jgi:hypothetical protein
MFESYLINFHVGIPTSLVGTVSENLLSSVGFEVLTAVVTKSSVF